MFLALKTLCWKLLMYGSTFTLQINTSENHLNFIHVLWSQIKFAEFYRNILFHWSSSLFASSELPSSILSNFLLFNKHFNWKNPILICYFSDKGLNFVYQLFDNNGNIKSWSSTKEEFGFNNFSNFTWQQII